jgi:hypothetical protein
MLTRIRILAALTLACALLAVTAPGAGASAFVGMTSEDTFSFDGGYAQDQLASMHRVHVGFLRQTFDWSKIEVAPGRYSFGLEDRFVLAAAGHGIRVLPVLFNPPSFRSSAPANPRRGTYPPARASDMANFAKVLVRRYGPRGTLWNDNPGLRRYAIRHWQIWNEPSLPVYWPSGPSPKRYVKLLRTVGKGIKKLDRKADIVSAAVPPSQLPGAVPILRYIRGIFKAKGRTAFNTLAINSYARNATELKRLLKSVRKLMNRYHDRRAKIWITELGWCDNGPRNRFCVGSRRQATNISRSFSVIRKLKRRYKLRGVVYFSWRDADPYPPNYQDMWGLHTGLLRKDGSAKPAFRAFSKAARRL